MKQDAPIPITMQLPQTEAGQRELRRRVSAVAAEAVITSIRQWEAPAQQKLELLQAVIDTVRERDHAEGGPGNPVSLRRGTGT